jgi:hypothetical protein
MNWLSIETAPFDRDLELAVIDFDGVHPLTTAHDDADRHPSARTVAMRRILLLILATILSTTTCHAAGSFQKPEPHVVKAGMPSIPIPSMPNVTAHDLVGGCGKGRIRDPQTHGCRGPSDIR